MAKVTVQGNTYELRFDLEAMEAIQGEMGNVQEAIKKSDIRSLRKLFVAMANSGQSYRGKPENVTGNMIKHATMIEVQKISAAIQETYIESMRTDTVNGEADDEHHDEIMEMMEAEDEKNGGTGEG